MPITQNPTVDPQQRPTLLFYLTDGAAVFGCVGNPNGVIAAKARSIAASDDGNAYYKTVDSSGGNAALGWTAFSLGGAGVSGSGSANTLTRWSGATAIQDLPNSTSDASGNVAHNSTMTIGSAGVQTFARVFVIDAAGLSHTILQRSSALTNTVSNVLEQSHITSGSVASGGGFGLGEAFRLETDNGNERGALQRQVVWLSAVDAGRTSVYKLILVNSAVDFEAFQLRPTGLILHDNALSQVISSGSQNFRLLLKQDGSGQNTAMVTNYNGNLLDGGRFGALHSGGTLASPTATQSGNVLLYLTGYGQFGTSLNNWNPGGEIRIVTTENWSAGNNGAQMEFYVGKNSGGGFNQVGKWHNFGAFCIQGNPTTVNAVNLLLVGNGIGFGSDVMASFVTASLDTTTSGIDVALGAGSGAYFLRFSELGDGTSRGRINISGCLEERVGRSSDFARTSGNYKNNATPASNSGTGETTLHSYSVGANSLRTDKDCLRLMIGGSNAGNANNKQLRLKFGATTFADTGAVISSGEKWFGIVLIVRTGAATQRIITTIQSGAAGLWQGTYDTTAAETLSGAVTLAITGQGGASNDITLDYSMVEYLPAAI